MPRYLPLLLVAVFYFIGSSTVNGQFTRDWISPAGGFFGSGANWSDGFVPGPLDTARFELDADYKVEFAAAGNVLDELGVYSGNVTFDSSSTTRFLESRDIRIRNLSGSVSTSLTIGDTNPFDVITEEISNHSFLTIQQESTVEVSDFANLSGNVTIQNGSQVHTAFLQKDSGILDVLNGSSLIASENFRLNSSFFGGSDVQVWVDNSEFISKTALIRGSDFTDQQALVRIFNKDGVWENEFDIINESRIEILNGASVTTNSMMIGSPLLATAITYVAREGSTLNVSAGLHVGDVGRGSLGVDHGAIVDSGNSSVARSEGSYGQVHIANGSTWNIDGHLSVGGTNIVRGGVADVEVSSLANLNADQITIWQNSSVTLNGGSITTGKIENNGRFHMVSGNLTLTDADSYFELNSRLTNSNIINAGSTRIAENGGITLASGDSFTTAALINDGTITLTGTANIEVGNLNRHDGYRGSGHLNVNAGSVTILDKGLAELGNLTTIQGGTINAANGLALGSGDVIEGFGSIDSRINAATGSSIHANGGTLSLGDAGSVVGYHSEGELYTGSGIVVVRDSNQANFGVLTNLGESGSGGLLFVQNGAIIDFGENVTGHGTIYSQNDAEFAFINNGIVAGNSVDELIALTGYVKGVGTFENVRFDGTFAPGLSPTISESKNFLFGAESVLEIELGGLVPGSEHDALHASELLSLDGTLDIILINGFNPEAGDTFELFEWGTLEGSFANFDLPTLTDGLKWNTSELYTSGSLSVTAVPEPNIGALAAFLIGCCVCRRKRKLYGGSIS